MDEDFNFDDIDEPSMRTMRGDVLKDSLGRIDSYKIIRKLGGGGFGVVYLVRDINSNVEYAIKTLAPDIKNNEEEMENLKNEFVLVSKLTHSNIAKPMIFHPIKEVVYSSEEVRKELGLSTNDFVMLMEYAPGVTLSKWRRQFRGRVVPLDKAIDICKQVASALDYAHKAKIIHRDVKPSNVMIEDKDDGDIVARVLDFGLATEIRTSMSHISLETNDISGTYQYMSPEQLQGKQQGPETDQYALACMFYELVSGAVPFSGAFGKGDESLIANIVCNDPPEALEVLSDDQNAVVQKALSKSAKNRFSTCSEFIDALAGNPSSTFNNQNLSEEKKPRYLAELEEERKAQELQQLKELREQVKRLTIKDQNAANPNGYAKHANNTFIKKIFRVFKFAILVVVFSFFILVLIGIFVSQSRKKNEAIDSQAQVVVDNYTQEGDEPNSGVIESLSSKNKGSSLNIVNTPPVKTPIVKTPIVKTPPEKVKPPKITKKKNDNQNLMANAIPSIMNNMVKIEGNRLLRNMYVSKYEVTQAQWQAVMGGDNPSHFKGDLSRPVENVSWNDCQDFIKRLNSLPEIKKSGFTFRLPTALEWEAACRAGSTGNYGLLTKNGVEGLPNELAWYSENSRNMTHPIGKKKPNAWGLYDMHGNVCEWLSSDSPALRGGCYNDRKESITARSNINSGYKNDKSPCYGLRLVATKRN